MIEELNTEKSIKTYSGLYINVFDPDPDTICIEDIAHALSHTARWGGHTSGFYSVAEHSLWVQSKVPKEFRLEALMHDATEAYIGDMPKPIKRYLPDYNKLEQNLDKVIRSKFGIPLEMSKEVKEVDYAALVYEWTYLKSSSVYPYNKDFESVKKQFLSIFKRLTSE